MYSSPYFHHNFSFFGNLGSLHESCFRSLSCHSLILTPSWNRIKRINITTILPPPSSPSPSHNSNVLVYARDLDREGECLSASTRRTLAEVCTGASQTSQQYSPTTSLASSASHAPRLVTNRWPLSEELARTGPSSSPIRFAHRSDA